MYEMIIGVYFFILVGILWFAACNYRTYTQRGRIIDFVFDQDDYPPFRDALSAVSYDSHLLALFLFRNPRKLYAPILSGAF